MPNIIEKDGKTFLELKKSEVEEHARNLGIIPNEVPEEELPQIEKSQAEKLADLATERQAKVNRLAGEYEGLGWTLSKRADEAAGSET